MASTNRDTDRTGAGLLPGILLTTPGRRRPGRSSRLRPGGSSRRRWRLAPGLQHLVATTSKKGKGEKRGKATVSTHPKYSQARIYTTYAWYMCKEALSVD